MEKLGKWMAGVAELISKDDDLVTPGEMKGIAAAAVALGVAGGAVQAVSGAPGEIGFGLMLAGLWLADAKSPALSVGATMASMAAAGAQTMSWAGPAGLEGAEALAAGAALGGAGAGAFALLALSGVKLSGDRIKAKREAEAGAAPKARKAAP